MNQILTDAFDIGSFNYQHNYLSYLIRILILFIPAVIIGYVIDKSVKYIQEQKFIDVKNDKLDAVIFFTLEFMIIITLFYILEKQFRKGNSHESEFQKTIPGALFLMFFFFAETNIINNFNKIIN